MFLNSHSIFKLGSLLCMLIMISIPSYTSTASYAQDNTTSNLTSSPRSHNVLLFSYGICKSQESAYLCIKYSDDAYVISELIVTD